MPITADQRNNYSAAELKERAQKQILGERKKNDKSFVSPHFGDGGWHTQPGALRFDPRLIQPMGDHVLVEVDLEPEKASTIVKPDIALDQERGTRVGTVLRVGPGAWKESKTQKMKDLFTRLPMTLNAGDRVIIGPYADWESWDAWAQGANVVLCQEADVRLVQR